MSCCLSWIASWLCFLTVYSEYTSVLVSSSLALKCPFLSVHCLRRATVLWSNETFVPSSPPPSLSPPAGLCCNQCDCLQTYRARQMSWGKTPMPSRSSLTPCSFSTQCHHERLLKKEGSVSVAAHASRTLQLFVAVEPAAKGCYNSKLFEPDACRRLSHGKPPWARRRRRRAAR
jgi:hypothetical protein